jgi:hypothetical protein
MIRPKLKVIAFGHTGSGKSTFAATFPKPMLVLLADGMGKDYPYWKTWNGFFLPDNRIGEMQQYQIEGTDSFIDFRDIQHDDGPIRIEYYNDPDPEKPTSFTRLQNRLAAIHKEFGYWQTIVADSMTAFEYWSRMRQQFVMNKMAKEPRLWYGQSKDDIERTLKYRIAAYPMNCVLIAHVDVDRDESAVSGVVLRNPEAPGKLRGNLAQQWMEMYYAYIKVDEKGNRLHLLQTQQNMIFNAQTQIMAPDGCWNHHISLWANFDASQAAMAGEAGSVA